MSIIQIRNVPPELHRLLKARAALEGKTLSDYLMLEIQHLAERPTPTELRRRLAGLPRIKCRIPVADMVRRERESR